MNTNLEQVMTRTATNMESLYSTEATDIYANLDATAERFIAQGLFGGARL